MNNNKTIKPLYRLLLNVGTFRDFAPYTANGCIDMIWFRSYHKYPKKIGGYKSIGYVPRLVTQQGGDANVLGHGEPFTQPSYPHIQNMQVDSPDTQDYNQPFDALKTDGAISDQYYQQYDALTSSKNARSLQDLQSIANSGGYGVVRKSINIIGDGKNTVISAGDAEHINGSTGLYPVSGVCFATNTDKNLQLTNFEPIFLPNALPSSPDVIIPMVWKNTFDSIHNYLKFNSNNQVYVGLTNDSVYWSETGQRSWNLATGLPTQSYYDIQYYGVWLLAAQDGVYWSNNAGDWAKSDGISVKSNAVYGSLVATDSGIYLTTDNGLSYTATAQTTGVFTCLSGTPSVVVAGTGDNKGIYYSTDSKTWTQSANVKTGNVVQIIFANNFLYAILSDNQDAATIYRSQDGINWTACRFNNTSDFSFSCTNITYNNNIFLLSTPIGIYYSTDGVSFTNAQNTQNIQIYMTAFNGNTYIAATNSGVLSSVNGINWFTTTITNPVNCVAYFNKWFTGIVNNGVKYSLTSLSLIQNATPAVQDIFTPNEYVWSLDTINLSTGQETVASATYVVAHPSCGLTKSIDDNTDYYVYVRNLGELSSNTAVPLRWGADGQPRTEKKNWLVPMIEGQNINPQATLATPSGNVMNSTVKVSGGVCAVGPFLFAYGNEGLIRNSDVNNPSQWFSLTNQNSVYRNSGLANDVNVGTSKIVKGLPYKGVGTKYAALFWSLDSLIMANFVGAPAVFDYTIISNAVTIIAANSAIEVYGNYYWIGDNRFYIFAGGQIQEVPNEMNRNWFFTNINPQRQHIIWASLNPQFNEIWWFFPKGDSYECNHALIYNYTDQTWYDTPINRSAGYYAGVYRHPVWVSNELDYKYYGWDYFLHEQGVDKIDYQGNVYPITSSFTTPDVGYTSSAQPAMPKSPQGNLQNWSVLSRVEPDGQMTGDWQLNVIGRRWARGKDELSPNNPYIIKEDTEHQDMREQFRIMFLQFSNSTIGGDWFVGNNMLTFDIGDCEGI